MYFPQFIKAGKVYKAIPPLYSIKEGKRNRYFIDNADMVKFVQKTFCKDNTITTIKNEKISDKELTKLFIRNADYTYFLSHTANNYAINPELLELILVSYIDNGEKFNLKKLKKEVESKYRFMTVDDKNGYVIGTIEGSNFIPLTDKFIMDCFNILRIMKTNDTLHYKVNGKSCTLYHIMNLYDNSMPKNVQRYKGLGEMPKNELGESTMDPKNRILIQYTMESAKEDIEFIRSYESDPKKILKHIGKVTREDLMD